MPVHVRYDRALRLPTWDGFQIPLPFSGVEIEIASPFTVPRRMTEQECEKMFDPFFTTRKSGTGLGLAVSHQIIEQHQGVIEVETAKGQGTTVMVVLPKRRGVSDYR